MAQLPACLPPALAPLTARLALQAITHRGPVAVVAMLGHAHPQGLILGQQHRHLLAHLRHHGLLLSHHGCEVGDAVLWHHVSMRHPSGKTG
jgi:hypothetical protein